MGIPTLQPKAWPNCGRLATTPLMRSSAGEVRVGHGVQALGFLPLIATCPLGHPYEEALIGT